MEGPAGAWRRDVTRAALVHRLENTQIQFSYLARLENRDFH